MVALFENVEKGTAVGKSVSGSQRAHMALLTAQEINNRTDILPSFQVPFLFRSLLGYGVSNAFNFWARVMANISISPFCFTSSFFFT